MIRATRSKWIPGVAAAAALAIAAPRAAGAAGEGESGDEAEPGDREEADEDTSRALERLGEDLDEAFREWGELEDEPEAEPEEEAHVDARADMPPAFYDSSTWPTAEIERPLSLGPGMLEIRAAARASLGEGEFFDPVSLAPDLLYGVSERLTVVLAHTRQAVLETPSEAIEGAAALGVGAPPAPAARAGDGLCVGARCTRFYDNVGITGRLALGALRGRVQLRVHAGFEAATLWPLRPGARAGVTGRLRLGRVAAVIDASVRLGLFRRGRGNEDVLSTPVTLQLQATPRLALELASGAYGPIGDVPSEPQIPLSAGLLFGATPAIDIGARFGFPALVGDPAERGARAREAALFAAYRL